MKYINIIALLLTSNLIIAMEAERKSLASFFDIDLFTQHEDIPQNIARQYVSDKQWWYVDKEIQYDHLCHNPGWSNVKTKNSFSYVHFNKTGTEIVALPAHAACCFICVWDRENGKELERASYDTHEEVIFSHPEEIWANRLYSSSCVPQLNDNERLWCEGSTFDESEVAVVMVKYDFTLGQTVMESKACVWDRMEGKESLQLKHDGPVNMARCNSQGVEIITASDDCTMRLWNGKTGQELLRIMYDTCVASAWFNEMGTEIVVATDDGKIQILAKYRTDNVSQILLNKLLHVWLVLQKPSKEIDSSVKLLDSVAQMLRIDWLELYNAWASFPEHMQTAVWLSMSKKIQRYGK